MFKQYSKMKIKTLKYIITYNQHVYRTHYLAPVHGELVHGELAMFLV